MVTLVLYIGDINDGCYLMRNDGRNFTHAEKKDNKQTKFGFAMDGEVAVEFDPVRRTVTYAVTNNGS
jgi:hypothetical protein